MNNNNDFEQDPPSYDYANQVNKSHMQGQYQDTSVDSFKRGELFAQAFSADINTIPYIKAHEVGKEGLLNILCIDDTTQNNELFIHSKATLKYPAFKLLGNNNKTIQFWPDKDFYRAKPLEDYDVNVQGSHPFLELSDYHPGSQKDTKTTTQHYFEITVERANPNTVMALGLTTRPYPIFRMPGWNKHSVGYHSDDGRKFCDNSCGGQDFAPAWRQGDIVGCGYCPETGTVYYTLNGKQVGTAFCGLEKHGYYPSVGADGPATISVNFGPTFRFPVENWAGHYV